MKVRGRPGLVHLLGCVGALVLALVLLNWAFPYLIDLVFPKAARPAGLRREAVDYLIVALVPIVVWLVPPLVRALARVTHHTHRLILGRSGFYVRFRTPRKIRFRDTVVRALGPFAIDLLVISEIEYYVSGADAKTFAGSLFSIPFLFLAGLVTSLLPGGWLVDALELRLVNPSKGEVIREAALFEGLLGPIGALALLVSFVTLAHAVGDSYEAGVVLLALWAARIFPAVLAAVSVYRIIVEPDVLPALERWADGAGLALSPGLGQVLEGLGPDAAHRHPTADASERVRDTSDPPGEEQERSGDD